MTTVPAALPHTRFNVRVRSRMDPLYRLVRGRNQPPVGSAPVAAGAEAYEGGSGPLGALVLHGFTGNRRAVGGWAEHLERDGFHVKVPRLPGHGTTWQEMNRTRWEDWYGEVESSFDELSAACEQTFVCGLSMGGGLALLLAARRGPRVAGLSLVNPSLHSDDLLMKTLPILRYLRPSVAAIGNDIAMPGVDEGAYTRTPLHAAWSMTKLWTEIQHELPRVDQPMLIYRSRTDHVVDDSSLRLIGEQVRSTELEIVHLERSYHVATLDYDADLIFSGTSEFFSRLAAAAK